MTNCVDCNILCSTNDSNECRKCSDRIHYKCLFNAKILPSAWTNNNTPPQYACAIFNSPNCVFYCNNCLGSINDISDSASNGITLSSIADKIDNIKTLIVDSNNIINNHHTKNHTYADTLKSSINSLTSKIIDIPREIAHATMDDLSVIIKMITNANLNTNYINSLFNDFNIDKSTVNEVNFKNAVAIISFKTVISKDRFLKLEFKNTAYNTLVKLRSLPYETRKLGLVYYHAIKSGAFTSHKSVFNNRTMCYELRKLSDNRIDWNSSCYSPSQSELSSWRTSNSAYTDKKSKAKSSN